MKRKWNHFIRRTLELRRIAKTWRKRTILPYVVLKRKTISLGGSVRKQFQQNLKIRNTFVIIVAALMNSAYICTTNWGYSWYLKESEILLRWLFLYWCHVHGYTRCKQARSIVLEMGGGGADLTKNIWEAKK